MSQLLKDQAAFKSVLARQDYTSWHSQPAPAQPVSSSSQAQEQDEPPKKKPRQKSNVVYSQPADTGTGTNVNTQLVYAVNHLKSTHNPVRLQDIAIVTGTPLDSDKVLLEKFKAHDHVHWDPRTDLYSYKHEFNFRSKAALLTEIQRSTRKGGGIAVRSLKESWKEAPAAIEELEEEGEVFVTRTQKDGQLKMVFWNEIKPNDESGGKRVEQEFVDLWHELKVPNEVDLLKQLASEGLKQTTSLSAPIRATTTKKKGKRGGAPKQRQARLTNTHLKGVVDLSRDYGT
ncbi:transcription initiation factor IIE subunit beta [Mycena floridula]|nr:transcription initiation factor IIE subunit beta [Mycena floridula]